MKKIISLSLALTVLLSTTGCFGEFQLTRKIYQWNDGVSDSKFVKTLLMYGLTIIPVYPVAAIGDLVIINLIEFWSGSNPLAMAPGEVEEQTVTYQGETYRIQATQNQFLIEKEGARPQKLVYSEEEQSWNLISEGESQTLLSLVEQDNAYFYEVHANDRTELIPAALPLTPAVWNN